MNSAPSSHDLARDLDSILSQSAPRPSNQNWPTPPTSNIQKSEKRSIGRRMSRALARYSVVFLIGIGATLAWQSYGDEAKEIAWCSHVCLWPYSPSFLRHLYCSF
jgi:hypothetical protein